MRKAYAAFLLDMDGTLIDSEPIHIQAHHEFLASKGIDIDSQTIESNIGGSDTMFYRELQERHGIDADVEGWVTEKWDLVIERFRAGGVPLRPGVDRLLDQLDALGLPHCIVTSTDRRVADIALHGAGLAERLPLRVCFEDTREHKPHPAPYHRALQRLGDPEPGHCLAIEDSVHGVEAAVAAGIPTIGFAGLIAAERLSAAGAYRCVEDLGEIVSP